MSTDHSRCPICLRGTPQDAIAELESSWVTMSASAPLRGYACLVFRRHAVELHDLSHSENDVFQGGPISPKVVTVPVYAPGEIEDFQNRVRQALGAESSRPTKVCPVVIRGGGSDSQVLVFRHPLAGVQLVKGTIELDETSGIAALRELREESGIESVQVGRVLGIWNSGHDGQVWEFVAVRVPDLLPDRWTHRAPDDGGHEFEFFWHDLAESPTAEWHPLFVAALGFIRACDDSL